MDDDAARLLTNRIYLRLAYRRPEIEKAERYYNGEQPLSFATDEWRAANAARYAGFSDNWCRPVVDAEAERLKVIGFTNIGDDTTIWDSLQRNEFDAQFSQGIVTTLSAKRTFIIVWGDRDGNPQVSFEHPSNVEIEYNWENGLKRKAALKTWLDETTEYATLYTPDDVWKYQRPRQLVVNEYQSQAEQEKQRQSATGGWIPRVDHGDDTWPTPNLLGVVPVVEMGNRPTLRGDPISEIEGVMPMQDAINLLWAYLFLSADYASMPARVLFGEPPKIPILDKDGKVTGSRVVEMKDLAKNRFMAVTGENAKIDSWEAARLDVFTQVIEISVGHIAAQTRTPPTYLVTNGGISNLSADGLAASEIGLNKKSREFQTFTNPAMREVARLVALVGSNKELAAQAQLAVVKWENPEIRSESQMADAQGKLKAVGYPFEYLLEYAGESPTNIKRIMEMKKAEDAELAALGLLNAAESASTSIPGPAI
jgi:hypothetical protein